MGLWQQQKKARTGKLCFGCNGSIRVGERYAVVTADGGAYGLVTTADLAVFGREQAPYGRAMCIECATERGAQL